MLKKKILSAIIITVLLALVSCKNEVVPKPSSYLRLDYPVAEYAHFENDCQYTFDINSNATIAFFGNYCI